MASVVLWALADPPTDVERLTTGENLPDRLLETSVRARQSQEQPRARRSGRGRIQEIKR